MSSLSEDLGDRRDWTDEALLAAVRRRDVLAYAEIYSRHHGAIRDLARRMVDRNEVDDLVAEVFMKMLRALRAGKGPVDNPIAYLYVATRTTAATMYTRRAQRDDVVVRLSADAVEGVELAHHFVDEQLLAGFRTLSARWQHVIWWSEVEGRSTAEIGDLLGISPGAAAALAHRARRALRRAYEDARFKAALEEGHEPAVQATAR